MALTAAAASALSGVATALIGAGASTATSAGLTKKARKWQSRENELAYERNKQSAEDARNWYVDEWNREAEYDSPSNVRSRLEAAGFNPYLAIDSSQLGFGNSATSSNIQADSVSPSNMSQFVPDTTSIGNSFNSISQVLSGYAQQKANIGKTIADTKNVSTNTSISDIDLAYHKEELILKLEGMRNDNNGKVIDNAIKSIEEAFQRSTFDTRVEYQSKMLDNLMFNNDLLALSREKLRFENIHQEEFYMATLNNVYADTYNKMCSGDLSLAQIELVSKQCITEICKQNNLNAQTDNILSLSDAYVGSMCAQYWNDYGKNNAEINSNALFDFGHSIGYYEKKFKAAGLSDEQAHSAACGAVLMERQSKSGRSISTSNSFKVGPVGASHSISVSE